MNLKTPSVKAADPMTSYLLGLIGEGRSARGELQPGLVEISHFSADELYHVKDIEIGSTLEEMGELIRSGKWFSVYGVSDTPEQALDYARKNLNGREGDYCVFVTHIVKDLSNAGNGGGWRWHKWGEYIGTGLPQREYLDDEEGFDGGVYVFHIYQVSNII